MFESSIEVSQGQRGLVTQQWGCEEVTFISRVGHVDRFDSRAARWVFNHVT